MHSTRTTKKDPFDKRFIFIIILVEIGVVCVAIAVFLALFFTPLSGQIARAADTVSVWAEATPAQQVNRTSQYKAVVFKVSTPIAATPSPIPTLPPPQITVQEAGLGQGGTDTEGLSAVTEEEYREGELNGVPVGIFIKVRSSRPLPLPPPPQPTPPPQLQPAGLDNILPDTTQDTSKVIPSSNEDTPLLGWPVQGKIKQGFGCSPYFTGIPGQGCEAYQPWFHDGVDIAATQGTPIRAMMAGTVIFAGPDGAGPACGEYRGFGLGVVLDNGDGWQTLYAHLSQVNVQVGEAVTPKTIIGTVGKTGCVTGSHLHFGLRHNGDLINPKKYIVPMKGESE